MWAVTAVFVFLCSGYRTALLLWLQAGSGACGEPSRTEEHRADPHGQRCVVLTMVYGCGVCGCDGIVVMVVCGCDCIVVMVVCGCDCIVVFVTVLLLSLIHI